MNPPPPPTPKADISITFTVFTSFRFYDDDGKKKNRWIIFVFEWLGLV